MNPRPLLLALSVGLAGVGACVLDRAGLSASSNSAGVGGSSSVTVGTSASGSEVITDGASSAGNGGAGGTTATAQSSSGVGGAGSGSSSDSSAAVSSSSSSAEASSSSSTGGGTTCFSQYGSALGFTLCAEKPTSCEFNVNLNQSTSCGAICAGLGGACVITLDNGAVCEYLGPTQDCAYTNYGNAVCVCSLGCGLGPPCPANKTCTGGLCTP